MTRATSFFLDGLRLAAALTVCAAHTANYWNPALVWPMQAWAHDAVIVFFVLSGYVIAHTTHEGARDLRAYAVARLSRLYSVVGPALALTGVLWVVGRELDPLLYAHYERAFSAVRFAATGLFLNAAWTLELSPPTNTPFWSLSYEFWYYVFFGVAVFVRSLRWRLLGLGAVAILVGPAILLLLPVWLTGVAAYVWRDRWHLPRSLAASGMVAALGVTGWMLFRLPDWPEQPGSPPWYFSGAAGSDLLLGLGWAAVIWFFNRLSVGVRVTDVFYRPMRWMAGHTFSLYLYHAPLAIFATALVPPILVRSGAATAALLGVLFAVIMGLGVLTEGQRPRWQRLFGWLWDKFFLRRRGV